MIINSFTINKKKISIKKKFKKFDNIFKKINFDYHKSNNTFHVLNKNFKFDFNINQLKKFKKFKNIVLIGMGGSILGSEAIYAFLKNKIKKNLFFFDDLNNDQLINFKKKNNIYQSLFIIISKSGNTIETLINFKSLKILKKNAKNIIIISEKKNNKLFSISKKYNLPFIEHKNYIGGRYSVLSEVGILPAYLMGVNTQLIRKKSEKYLKNNQKNFLKKNTEILANFILVKKFKNIILLNYEPKLEKFLFWYQQLCAESLGKQGLGLLPIISNAPKDHHSLLQLYLDGPSDKIFYIFGLKSENNELNKVKNAQKKAVKNIMRKLNIPFREFNLTKANEEVLGELLSYFMIETAIVGKLININPFNQPAVEQVKTLTKKFLN